VNDLEDEELKRSSLILRYLVCILCCRRMGQVNLLYQIIPQNELELKITYEDLQKLLEEFKEQMEVLKAKLKEDNS
jgi:hypothetical protein